MNSRYVAISYEQFRSRMDRMGFIEVELPGTLERVWQRQVIGAKSGLEMPYAVRIYSTVDLRSNVSREVDSDAIRVQLTDLETHKLVGESYKVLRTKSALDNTEKNARLLWKYAVDPAHHCPHDAHHLLVKRKSANGPFLGCTRYPDCKGTRRIEAAPAKLSTKRQRAEENAEAEIRIIEGSQR